MHWLGSRSRLRTVQTDVAATLSIVGERWALLIIRDLIMGPKRFSDLNRGLPGIPSNVLTARLKELEQNGIVARRVLPSRRSSPTKPTR